MLLFLTIALVAVAVNLVILAILVANALVRSALETRREERHSAALTALLAPYTVKS